MGINSNLGFFLYKISQLQQKQSASEDDLMEISSDNGTKHDSKSATVEQVSNAISTEFEYSELTTTNKTIVGAINDVDQGHTSVEVNQIVTDGTNIADVTVNSVTTDIYTPEIVANPNDITGVEYLENLTIDGITYAVNKPLVYGFHIDSTESNPDTCVTYLNNAIGMTPAYMNFSTGEFNYGSWGDVWFIRKCRPCITDSNKNVITYLDKYDYTKDENGNTVTIDSTMPSGYNVMIEFPTIWIKIVPDPNSVSSVSIYVSELQVDEDFKAFPYLNRLGRVSEKLYLPAFNASGTSILRSVSNAQYAKPSTLEDEINGWQKNGVSYHPFTLSEVNLVNILLVLISKSLDTQSKFGEGLSTGGTSAINDGFRTGVHNDKGLFYGTNSNSASTYTNAVKVFGIENWYGFSTKRILGHIYKNGNSYIKLCYGMSDGSTTEDYNTDGTGYLLMSSTPTGTSGNYIKTYTYENNSMIPLNSPASGSTSSTYYCDTLSYPNTTETSYISTRSGNPIAFETYKASNAISTIVSFTPKQEGTGNPSPSNIRQIIGMNGVEIGVYGKNIFNESTIFHGHYSSTDGSLTENEKYRTAIIDNLPAGTYTFSTTLLNTRILRYWTNGGNTFVNVDAQNYTVTTTANSKFMICWRNESSTEITEDFNTQIELGTTATVYEPYISPTIYNISWQTEAGTVYAGTLDVETGVLRATHALYDLTDTKTYWTKSTSYPGGFYRSATYFNPSIKTNTPFVCSHAKSAISLSDYASGTCFMDGSVNIRIMADTDTVQDWYDYLDAQNANGTPVCIACELATPITYQLTPTQTSLLKGNNTIITTADDLKITYTFSDIINSATFGGNSISNKATGAFNRTITQNTYPKYTSSSGNPVVFTTGSKGYAVNTKINFTTSQSGTGTPSPSNVRPLVGVSSLSLNGCGKNLYGTETLYRANYAMNGSGTQYPNSSYDIYRVDKIGSIDGRLSWYDDSEGLQNLAVVIVAYNENDEIISVIPKYYSSPLNERITNVIVTIPEASYFLVSRRKSSSRLQFEAGTQSTAYEQYTPGTNITINLGDTYYGGVVDVEAGMLRVTHVIVDMGTLDWSRTTSSLSYVGFYATMSDMSSGYPLAEKMCSAYKVVDKIRTQLSDLELGVFNTNSEGSRRQIFLRDDSFAEYTAEQVQTALSGVMLVYELATPIEIPLTPQIVSVLNGNNTLTTNGTNITVVYQNNKNNIL